MRDEACYACRPAPPVPCAVEIPLIGSPSRWKKSQGMISPVSRARVSALFFCASKTLRRAGMRGNCRPSPFFVSPGLSLSQPALKSTCFHLASQQFGSEPPGLGRGSRRTRVCSTLLVDRVPFMFFSDLRAHLRRHRWHRLAFRYGSVTQVFLESRLGKDEDDRQSFGSRILQGNRKSTRLNSSHPSISYAVFCLKKKK